MDPNNEPQLTEEPDYAGLLASLGVTSDPDPTPNADPDPAKPADPNADPAKPTEQQPSATDPAKPVEQPPVDKTAQAFAAMRVQNKQYATAMQSVAKLLGLEDTDPNKIIPAIQQKLVQEQATQQKVPVELLQRLQTLEQLNQQREQEEIQKNAFLGFQQLKDKFKLDDNALQTFAANLASSGVNPFEQKVDVVHEYMLRNFDALIKAAEERGKQAEVDRSTNAQTHSGTVIDKDGNVLPGSEKIDTVAGLTEFFRQAMPQK